ncbi:MAG: hypothetical protein ACYCT1_08130 [Steroidobacteraceae bacterium]
MWVESLVVRTKLGSITIPAGGYSDRCAPDLPGGPIVCDLAAEVGHYEKSMGENATWLPKVEQVHDDGFYIVDTVSIHKEQW